MGQLQAHVQYSQEHYDQLNHDKVVTYAESYIDPASSLIKIAPVIVHC